MNTFKTYYESTDSLVLYDGVAIVCSELPGFESVQLVGPNYLSLKDVIGEQAFETCNNASIYEFCVNHISNTGGGNDIRDDLSQKDSIIYAIFDKAGLRGRRVHLYEAIYGVVYSNRIDDHELRVLYFPPGIDICNRDNVIEFCTNEYKHSTPKVDVFRKYQTKKK